MALPLLVGEIGINHNGDLWLAKSVIALCANLGIPYVKFQKRTVEKCYTPEVLAARKITRFGTTVGEWKRGLEFEEPEYDAIDAYAKQEGVKWFASPRCPEDVRFLARYKPPFMKIASGSLPYGGLLEAIKETGIPVIIGTGMATQTELDEAMRYLGTQVQYLLHTTSMYPVPDAKMNMARIHRLRELYGTKCKIGFSNHSTRIIYCVQACAMGVDMVEFHVTLDRNLDGPDHEASIGPMGIETMLNHARAIEAGWGSPEICPLPEELTKGASYPWRRK